jgi:hypothetical protein
MFGGYDVLSELTEGILAEKGYAMVRWDLCCTAY